MSYQEIADLGMLLLGILAYALVARIAYDDVKKHEARHDINAPKTGAFKMGGKVISKPKRSFKA